MQSGGMALSLSEHKYAATDTLSAKVVKQKILCFTARMHAAVLQPSLHFFLMTWRIADADRLHTSARDGKQGLESASPAVRLASRAQQLPFGGATSLLLALPFGTITQLPAVCPISHTTGPILPFAPLCSALLINTLSFCKPERLCISVHCLLSGSLSLTASEEFGSYCSVQVPCAGECLLLQTQLYQHKVPTRSFQ